ncbi:glycosyltransferase family 4 protein [Oscillatoria salina]|uniref:glycosyltransferase family 4 protein n=1 Tax=Oscillatoria salina TaxID=331517 RepID=UPI0013BCE1BA|nr:glycosyltransferase family 4 protein [Oscillatoria salina]MBZ8179906.1 glycosyltransferase family 4 protein [Oscillatoria salina IIICB1]NET87453.1 glycosyltransferase family 4 protein [Kamptonema sp. SIO1D9]
MRILIYSYNYYPEPIGIAPLMTELAEGLVKRGHQVRVVTAMPWYPNSEIYDEYKGKLYLTEQLNGVKVQRCYVRASPQRNFRNRALFEISFVILSFIQALFGPRPDVILLTVPGLPVGVPAAVLGWLYQVPVVLNLQDILPDAAVHVGLLTNKKLIRIFEGLEKFAYRIATKISVISEGFVDNLLMKKVPAEKITLIPNWVNVNFIKPLPEENNTFRQEHYLEGKFVIMYSGNIALTQGLETVIEAASQLRDLEKIEFVIVGEEKALARLERRCKRCGADNVLLLPFQPRPRLPEMLAAADIGLVVQKRNVIAFNMPSKIQVLLASGRAIIASVPATGTAAKAIKASGGGIVVPPEDPQALANAIKELYFNPEKVAQLGKQSREHAIANYSFESALERYEQLFLAVTQG